MVPKITAVSSNAGSLKGQDLELQGLGFSSDPSTVSVNAGGRSCKVTESSSTNIKCRVEEGATTSYDSSATATPGQFVSGTGITFKKYNLTDTGLNYTEVFRAKYITNSTYFDDKLLLSGRMSELEELKIPALSGYFVNGYFKAPYSANGYKFYISSDDTAEFYIAQ